MAERLETEQQQPFLYQNSVCKNNITVYNDRA